VLTVLSTLLEKAVEWGVIPYVPCTIRLLKTSQRSVEFYDFDDYERLIAAARARLHDIGVRAARRRCRLAIRRDAGVKVGATSIRRRTSSVSSATIGEGTCPPRKEDGSDTCR
jgi:hypothetical protein